MKMELPLYPQKDYKPHQQNKTMIDVKVDNRKDLNSSQILILHHNVQGIKIRINCLITIGHKKC
jgi:hypothetical protein